MGAEDVNLLSGAKPTVRGCIRDWGVNGGWLVVPVILQHEVGEYELDLRPLRCVVTNL